MNAAICAFGAALLTAVPCAHADISIEWAGPPDCADATVVESEIARLLPGGGDATIRAAVTVTHAEAWGAVVRLEDDGAVLGERTFEAGSCEELRGAVALLIVLAIDPDAALAIPEPLEEENDPGGHAPVTELGSDTPPTQSPGNVENAAELGLPQAPDGPALEAQEVPGEQAPEGQAPEAGSARERSDPDAQIQTNRPTREVIERSHWGVAARAGVDFGALPAPSPVLSVGVFHQRRRFGLGIHALAVLPQDESTAVEASGRFALGALRATPGLHLRYGLLMMDLRGVVELGVMGGRGRDVEGPQTGYSLWAALGAEAALAIRIGPISLGFRGDIRVPLNRPLYAFRGPLGVHRTASLVGRAEFALGLHFL